MSLENRGDCFPHLQKVNTQTERNQIVIPLLEEERKAFKELCAVPRVSHLIYVSLSSWHMLE